MGQQQLLLLVLATVIVGLATVAGIQAFEQGQNRANMDALTQSAVKIASDAQARVKEPSQFGGYDGNIGETDGSSSGYSELTIESLGYNSGGDQYSFYDPGYETSSGECGITGTGSTVTVECQSETGTVTVEVTGTAPDNITTTSQTMKS